MKRSLMVGLKALGISAALSILAFSPALSETATQQEMTRVSQNWLSLIISQKGEWSKSKSPVLGEAQDIVVNDTLLGRYFVVEPNGYIVVPNLKELSPVKAYSEDSRLDLNDPDGFSAMLREVLQDRIRLFVKAYGSMEVAQPTKGETLFGVEQRAAWDRFSAAPEIFDRELKEGNFKSSGDLGPLLTTSWHQGAPYNNKCPWGDGGRTVVGCVATATAQIMAYYKWPPEGTGSRTLYWMGDNSCGGSTPSKYLVVDYTDPYDWDNIRNTCSIFSPPEQQEAVSNFCYEVGVAVGMMYGRCGSGAYMFNVPTAFSHYFRYKDSVQTVERIDYSYLAWSEMIRTEVEAGRPVQYVISKHSIVADGWRMVEPIHQVHMNYGWNDGHTAWYSIDQLYCPWEGCSPLVEEMLINIKPDRDVQFAVDTSLGFGQLDAKFAGSSLLPVDQWIWDFGDGDSAFVQSPEHLFNSRGRFTVQLSIVSGAETREYNASNYVTILDDSLIAIDAIGKPDSAVSMIIYARNTVPVRQIQIPIHYGGELNLILDSFSTVGCRTAYFDTYRFSHFDPSNNRATIAVSNSTYNPDIDSYNLEPGLGPVLKVYFTIPETSSPGDSSIISFDPYMTYSPLLYSSLIDYSPSVKSGKISMSYVCGDANCNGIVNALDITYLINYLYKHGTAPVPLRAGDVNNSGGVNALDITYLINYTYKHGSGPNCP